MKRGAYVKALGPLLVALLATVNGRLLLAQEEEAGCNKTAATWDFSSCQPSEQGEGAAGQPWHHSASGTSCWVWPKPRPMPFPLQGLTIRHLIWSAAGAAAAAGVLCKAWPKPRQAALVVAVAVSPAAPT